ncbi:hypothetical protein SLA2020_412690 [Shorea laevis]
MQGVRVGTDPSLSSPPPGCFITKSGLGNSDFLLQKITANHVDQSSAVPLAGMDVGQPMVQIMRPFDSVLQPSDSPIQPAACTTSPRPTESANSPNRRWKKRARAVLKQWYQYSRKILKRN